MLVYLPVSLNDVVLAVVEVLQEVENFVEISIKKMEEMVMEKRKVKVFLLKITDFDSELDQHLCFQLPRCSACVRQH